MSGQTKNPDQSYRKTLDLATLPTQSLQCLTEKVLKMTLGIEKAIKEGKLMSALKAF